MPDKSQPMVEPGAAPVEDRAPSALATASEFASDRIGFEMNCNVCFGTRFEKFAIRRDGAEILQCSNCGLGVLAAPPASTAAFYGDNYYVQDEAGSGYADYGLMAEHGLGWVAALVQTLRSEGRILDIGCADGYLLGKLGDRFQKFGIEVNARAAAAAAARRIDVLGNDVLDQALVQRFNQGFDIVTAIAVFEHLLDFRGGFEAALAMLAQDGFLLFEVPLMSSNGSNRAWLESSFEHIYYPTERSIRHLVETVLGCRLAGGEIVVRGYASTYVGLVVKDENAFEHVGTVFARILAGVDSEGSRDERRAATHLHLLHAAQSSLGTVASLAQLPPQDFNPQLIARVAQVWSFDLQGIEAQARTLDEVQALRMAQSVELTRLTGEAQAAAKEIDRLTTDAAKRRRDALRDQARATAAADAELHRIHAEMEVVQRKATQQVERANDAIELERVRASGLVNEIGQLRDQLAATGRRLEAIESSASWRAMAPLRRAARRMPRLARRMSQGTKLLWWTLNGTIGAHTREFFRRRRAAASESTAAGQAAATATDNGSSLNAQALLAATQNVRLLPEIGLVADATGAPPGEDWPADRPLVSVVIPCFNYGHLVADAIRSVEAQTFANLEIIVVEGGSTSEESRNSLIEATQDASSRRMRVLMQDKPHRAGANRNFGISHARGKYICCLDADDRLAPTYIEKAVFMLEHVGYDVVSTALQFFGNRWEVWAPDERPTLDKLLVGNQVLTCAVFKRSLWKDAGGYRDSDLSTGHVHEDWLFWVRLAALGARFINFREPLFHYRSHGQTLSNSESVLEHEAQRLLVRKFNSDVLTPEAIERARSAVGAPRRPPRSFRPAPHAQFALAPQSGPTLLLAVPFLVLGGAERLLSALVANLVKHGWRVIIVTTIAIDAGAHGDTTSWFESSTAEIYHLPRFLEPEHWRDFVDQLFDSRGIDILWVVGSAVFYDDLPRLRLHHPALRIVDLLFNTVGHTTNNRRYAGCLDLTFVESTEVRDWLLEAGESAQRVCLIQSGVDLLENRPALPEEDLATLCGLPKGNVVVGFFGRWSPEKDPLGFVEIAKRVAPELGVTFVMTGAGPLEAELKASIDAAGFGPGRFLLKGAVPDLKPYLRACDILVLPSLLDGRPNVIMEALASGVAIVASRVGALPEMFEDAHQGYLCTPGDYDEFASRITALVGTPELLSGFQRDARRWAERRLDIRAMHTAYVDRLCGLVSVSTGLAEND